MYSENFRKSSNNYSVKKVIFNYGKNQVTWRKNLPKDGCFSYSAILITHNFTFLHLWPIFELSIWKGCGG